jgi:chromosome segregation protein
MLLKKIEISGFKSFAKKSVLDFKTPITAIVGPNGSGKSNVAEAFSFVLGEQSIKSLRGKRGEDMIFNGSKTNSRSNRANVKVIFDNSKKFLDIEYNEVIVERVVHRDSTNQYLINGTQVRLKDVIELLAKANIGSSGHHIISQGEADRVLNVNPKERKILIEDALGLKIYQIKRKESERKLERTEENIKQVGSLRKEIKPHLSFLRKQARKIEKTLEMRVELMVIYKEYLRRESGYLEEKKKYIEEEGRDPKERMAILEKELEKVQKITSKSEEGEKSKELRESEEKIRKIRGEKDKVSFNLGRLEGELSSREKILEREERRQKERTISVSEVQKVVDEVDKEIDSAEKDPTKIKTVLSEVKRLIKSLVSRGDSTSLSDLKNDKQSIGDLKIKISRGKNETKALEGKEKELNEKVRKLREEIEENRESQMGAEKQTFQIMSEQQDLKIKLNELKNLNERIEREEGNFKREITEATSLLGREVLSYEDLSLKDNEGTYITSEDMAEEDRYMQEDRKRKIEKIKIRLEDAGGASGEEILREFEEVNERDQFLEKEIDDLEETAKSLKDLVKELEEKLEVEFKKGIIKINQEFQEFFSLMFGGGSASLSIVKTKEEEDASDGIDINVSLPRKRIKGLMVLSGGERALTSIALLFAMSQVQPPPFIVLDETDAALDEANSKKYGDMVKSLSEHSQLILITHNRETMSRAGVLYGVTMGSDGVSKLLSVDLEEAVEVSK